jgi:hypothetical protein
MWFQKDKSSLSDSFLGWLMGEEGEEDEAGEPGKAGGCKSTPDMGRESRLIEARLRIIKTLKQRGLAEGAPLLRRVARAPALEDLWYLRPEIMQCLSSLHGETQAHSIMTSHIAPLFAGSLSTHIRKPHRPGRALQASR